MVYLLFENLERASVSLLMLSAKQGNHWYHFLLLYKVHSDRRNVLILLTQILLYHVIFLSITWFNYSLNPVNTLIFGNFQFYRLWLKCSFQAISIDTTYVVLECI